MIKYFAPMSGPSQTRRPLLMSTFAWVVSVPHKRAIGQKAASIKNPNNERVVLEPCAVELVRKRIGMPIPISVLTGFWICSCSSASAGAVQALQTKSAISFMKVRIVVFTCDIFRLPEV